MICLTEDERNQGPFSGMPGCGKPDVNVALRIISLLALSSFISSSAMTINIPFPTCLTLTDYFWSGFQGLMYGFRTDDRWSFDATREQLRTVTTVVYRYSSRYYSR
jgi:hypothetical protein